MDVFRYLHALSERNGSDLFFSVGAPVTLKREGHYHPLEEKPLGPGEVKQLAYQLMSQKQIAEFERTLEMNLAVGRSEEHTSELQSRPHLVCRLLLEKKKKNKTKTNTP